MLTERMPIDDWANAQIAAAEAVMRLEAAWILFNHEVDKQYRAACSRDPGLKLAVAKAQLMDPDIGWLDVAAFRETARQDENARRPNAD